MEKRDRVRMLEDKRDEIVAQMRAMKSAMIYFYPKKDGDSLANNKWLGLTYFDGSCVGYYLRSTRDTKDCFDAVGEGFSDVSSLSSTRYDKLYKELNALSLVLSKVQTDGMDAVKLLKPLAYAVIIVKDYDIYYYNLIEDKLTKKDRRNTYCWNGFYYNPDFGDKVLEFFEKGFNNTYRIRCEECGETRNIAYEESDFKFFNGYWYCNSCLERKHFGICELTGKEGFRTQMEFKTKADEKEVMKKLGRKAKVGMFINTSYLYDKGLTTCSRCGAWYVYHGNSYCSDCRKGVVGDYSDKNYMELKCRNENTKTRYGFELETEMNGNCRRFDTVYKINDQIGDLIKIKHDGSLSNGFEIVSHILTFKKFCSIKNRFGLAFKNAIKDGCYSKRANTTGLHIHISREGFKDANHLARFCRAWYINKEFTKYCAQRDFGQYREWNAAIASDKDYFFRFLNGNLYRINSNHGARYNIVNLNNEETVEIRIFKGILSVDFVSYAIELCNLIKNYTEENEEIKSKEMIKYIIKNSTRKLKEFVKFFVIKDRCAIKEVA